MEVILCGLVVRVPLNEADEIALKKIRDGLIEATTLVSGLSGFLLLPPDRKDRIEAAVYGLHVLADSILEANKIAKRGGPRVVGRAARDSRTQPS